MIEQDMMENYNPQGIFRISGWAWGLMMGFGLFSMLGCSVGEVSHEQYERVR